MWLTVKNNKKAVKRNHIQNGPDVGLNKDFKPIVINKFEELKETMHWKSNGEIL